MYRFATNRADTIRCASNRDTHSHVTFAATMAKWNLLQAKDLPQINAQLKGGGLAPLGHGTALMK
jgi:hypothetical protein